jgi:hypothetical protein
MLARKIIAILLSLTALGLSACQGNRLNGSTSSSVATEVSGFLPLGGLAKPSFAPERLGSDVIGMVLGYFPKGRTTDDA